MAIARDSHVHNVFSCTNITQMSLKNAVVCQLFHILRKGNENKYKDRLSKEKEYKQYVRVLSI